MYALSLFGIPVKNVEKMERIQRDFLWTGVEGRKRYPLVAWENVFLPKHYGGLGIRKLTHLNKALLAKQLWRICNSSGDWRETMINKYINSHSTQSIINNEDFPKGSVIWNGIQKARGMAKAMVSWKLGNGEDIQFWMDN